MANTYIEPSELRSTSKLIKYTSHIDDNLSWNPEELPGLEQKTGADFMISPEGLPRPVTDFLLKDHIKRGAYLVQVKFGHDLVASIFDNRYKDAQSRMKLIGAAPWQRILLFIGLVSERQGKYQINGQSLTSILGAKAANFGLDDYRKHVGLWNGRGGIFEQLYPASHLPRWIKVKQELLIEFRNNPQKYIYPQAPRLYEEELEFLDNPSVIEREWLDAQKLTPIKDFRITLKSLPGVGPKMANDIFQWLEVKSWYGFMEVLENGKISEVKGVGKKTIKNVLDYLKKEVKE